MRKHMHSTHADPAADKTTATPAATASNAAEQASATAALQARTHSELLHRATPVRIVASPHDNVPIWLRTLAGWTWRLIALVAGVVLLVMAVARVQEIFIALFIAATMASVLRPLRHHFERRMSRGKAVLISMILAFLSVTAILAFVIFSVVTNWRSLSNQFTSGLDQIITWLQTGPLHINLPFEHVRDGITQLQQYISQHGAELGGRAIASVGTFGRVMTTGALALFCTIFFLSSGNEMWQWLMKQLPTRERPAMAKAFRAGWGTFADYARGTAIIALVEGILAAILLTVLRVPLSVPLAVLVAIGTAVPLIGGPLVMIIAAVVALAADGPIRALIVLITVALLGQLEGRVLEPMIYGKATNLHPVVVAVGVTAGAMLAGIIGAMVAVPLIAMAWNIYKALRNDAWLAGGVSDEPFAEDEDDPIIDHTMPITAAVIMEPDTAPYTELGRNTAIGPEVPPAAAV